MHDNDVDDNGVDDDDDDDDAERNAKEIQFRDQRAHQWHFSSRGEAIFQYRR